MELRFTVWQFVRLMVHVEEGQNLPPDQRVLLEDWQAVWSELDRNLTELAETDPDAYGALMMDQDVIFEDATETQAKAAREALEVVMAELDEAMKGETDEELLGSLKFERRELRQLTRKLARQTLDDGDRHDA